MFSSSLSILESLSVAVVVYAFLEFLHDLGKRIVIMDISILALFLTCILMPVIFYHVYTRENHLARLWVKYMPVESDDYFSFALPAVFAMAWALRIRIKKLRFRKTPLVYLENVKRSLSKKPTIGISLIGIGLVSGLLDFLAPDSLKQIFYLADHLTYVGVFYIIYSPFQYKRIIVPGVIALMLGQSVVTGMFGEMIYILACSLTLILLGSKISFYAKLTFAVLGIFMILVLQSIKMEYRHQNWELGKGADPVYFAALIASRVTDVSSLMDPDNMFFTAVRMNQGWLVAVTMKRVPARFPFGYGETIWKSVASSFIPRFIWPDKPKAGGKENLLRYWGFIIVGYSMNIGTLGEAYANFGKFGGVAYMFAYGFFFNFFLSSILKLAEKRPTIILWLPFLFFYSISVETDLFTTMGALVKSMIFTWIIFKFYEIAFHIEL
jgi:hypothetical protein